MSRLDVDPTLVYLGVGRAGRYVTLHNAGIGRAGGDGPTKAFLKALDDRGLFDHLTIQPEGKKCLGMFEGRWPQFQSYCMKLGVTLIMKGDH